MNEIIPFKKDVLFKTKISEITDISLEHDYKIMDEIIDGDFILEGTYKITEASMINEDFFYKIPFSISITDNYEKESINLTIKDFSYEIKNDDILSINVELNLEAREKEILDEVIDEIVEEENNNILEDEIIDEKDEIIDEIKEGDINKLTESFDKKENFVTYKVYIAKEGDTIDSISYKYNTTTNELLKYNLEEVNIGDKIIIPSINE